MARISVAPAGKSSPTASKAGLNTEPPQMPIIPSGGQLPQTPLAPGAAAAAAASMEPKMKVSFSYHIASRTNAQVI